MQGSGCRVQGVEVGAEGGQVSCLNVYRGTSLMIKRLPLGPYSRTLSRALWWS